MKRSLAVLPLLLLACSDPAPGPSDGAAGAPGEGGAGGEGGTLAPLVVRDIGDSRLVAVDAQGLTAALAAPEVGGRSALSLLHLDTGRYLHVAEGLGNADVSFQGGDTELLVRSSPGRYDRIDVFGTRSGLPQFEITSVSPGTFRYLEGRRDMVWVDSSRGIKVRLGGAQEKQIARADSTSIALHGSTLAYRANGKVEIVDLDADELPLPTPLEREQLAFAGEGALLLSWTDEEPGWLSVLVLESREVREVERFSAFDVDPTGQHVAALVEEVGSPVLLVLDPAANLLRTLPASGAHAVEFGPAGRHLILSEQHDGELHYSAVDLETDGAHELAALPACAGPSVPRLDAGERHLVVWSGCGPGGSNLLRLDLSSGVSETMDVAEPTPLLETADGGFAYLATGGDLRTITADGRLITLARGLLGPPWSGPGGESLVFAREDAEGPAIVRLDVATRRERVLSRTAEPPAGLSVLGRVVAWREAGANRLARLP